MFPHFTATGALVIALLACGGSACSTQNPELVVSAAASLTDVLNGIKDSAEKETGCKIVYNFGGSGTLRKQIEQGAPADVFFPADMKDMDLLQKNGKILPDTRRDLLANRIVLVAPRTGTDTATNDLPALKTTADLTRYLASAGRCSIGNPAAVPAGRYAEAALEKRGLYGLLKNKTVLGGSVRQVLQHVASGSVDCGIVFMTDWLAEKGKLRLLSDFRDGTEDIRPVYPVAVVAASKLKDKAGQFIAFLAGPAAVAAFKKAGFEIR